MANGHNKKNRRWFAFFVLGWMMLLAPCALAQPAGPAFNVDAVNVRSTESPGRTRVDIYTRLPYSGLHFYNRLEGFAGRYEVTAEFYELDDQDRRQNLVQSRIWTQEVSVPTFAATQSDQIFDRTTQSVEIQPGRYLLEVKVEDQATKRSYVRQVPLVVRNLNKPVAVSDVIILDSYDAGENTIAPRVSHDIGSDQESMKLFYELYTRQPERVRVTREVIQLHKGKKESTLRSIFGLDRDQDDLGEVTYTRVEATPLKTGRTQVVVEIPTKDMKVGDYLVRVRVENENNRLLDLTDKMFSVHWSGLDQQIENLDEAIAQLTYIAKGKDIKYIRSGQTQTERLNRFREFWKKRDPTPETERNERMEEYYYRVASANKNYGSLLSGWKTDRGHVAILFGEPDYVERHPFNFNTKPYEVWFYYGIGRQFIFIDKTGLGDYEIMIPIWDDRTRIR